MARVGSPVVLLLQWIHLAYSAGTADVPISQEAAAASPDPYNSENPSPLGLVSVERNHSSWPLNLVLGVVIGVLGILIAFLLLMILLVLKKKQSKEQKGPSPFFRHFTCKEIERATDGFSTIIGKGSHGVVYKARFLDGLVAAVKEVKASQHGKDAFYRELQLLGRLHHRHLVTLRGFSAGHERFLVFEYMENRSLKEHLQDPLKTPLDWRTRLRIAVDVAAALEYLHFFCVPPIYLVAINSSNVLLDENFVAKLSHIGFVDSENHGVFASNATMSRDHTVLKPSSPQSLLKHAIFEFGVLLLELITGQSVGPEGAELVEWIENFGFNNSMHKMVDTDLGDNYDIGELKSLFVIARLCTRIEDKSLASMSLILRYLQRKFDHSVPDVHSPKVMAEESFACL